MTDDCRERASGELAKIRAANDELWVLAAAARQDGKLDSAAELEAEAAATSFRLAAAWTALAALGRDTPPDGDADYVCTACGGLAGIFQGQPGWRHYRPGPPVEVYDPGHEVTGPAQEKGPSS